MLESDILFRVNRQLFKKTLCFKGVKLVFDQVFDIFELYCTRLSLIIISELAKRGHNRLITSFLLLHCLSEIVLYVLYGPHLHLVHGAVSVEYLVYDHGDLKLVTIDSPFFLITVTICVHCHRSLESLSFIQLHKIMFKELSDSGSLVRILLEAVHHELFQFI